MFASLLIVATWGAYDVQVFRPGVGAAAKPKSYDVEVLRPVDVSTYAVKIALTAGNKTAMGSGVNTASGVLTANHVVKGYSSIEVICGSETAKAKVIASDEKNDLALLGVKWKKSHPVAPLSADHAAAHDLLQSAGRSKDGRVNVEAHNVISASGKEIRFENASNSGRSGAGIFNDAGELVGIVTGNAVDTEPYAGIATGLNPLRKMVGGKPAASGVHDRAELLAEIARYPQYVVDGHDTDDDHLINTHGVDPADLEGLTQEQKNRLHGMKHEQAKAMASKPAASQPAATSTLRGAGGCPGGVCPAPVFQRRLFRKGR